MLPVTLEEAQEITGDIGLDKSTKAHDIVYTTAEAPQARPDLLNRLIVAGRLLSLPLLLIRRVRRVVSQEQRLPIR